MAKRPVVFVGLLLLASLIFTLFPQVDQGVSGLFYRSGGGFFLYANPIIRTINGVVPPLAVGSGIVLVTILAWAGWTKRPVAGLSWRAAAYLLAVLLVAPGLLANTVLKDHWGRARPSHTVAFGGKKTFTPALIVSDQCDHNCSFVCGHAAMAFTPMALAFVLRTRRQRRYALAAGLGSGGLVGVVRIIEGGHFLSDVLFAGLLVYGVAWGLATVMLQHIPSRLQSAARRNDE